MGLDVFLYDDGELKVELPSAKYPDHLFKIGYFRSSYNGGGFNSVMRQAGLDDLSAIFAAGEEYEFKPDWSACLERAEQALEKLNAYAATPEGAYAVLDVTYNMFSGPNKAVTTERRALDIFAGELAKDTNRDKSRDAFMGRAYSNQDGEFYFGDGLKVHGFVHGVHYNQPCTYVVYHAPDRWTWYRQALEIVIETCEYVLASGRSSDFLFHWSG